MVLKHHGWQSKNIVDVRRDVSYFLSDKQGSHQVVREAFKREETNSRCEDESLKRYVRDLRGNDLDRGIVNNTGKKWHEQVRSSFAIIAIESSTINNIFTPRNPYKKDPNSKRQSSHYSRPSTASC